jgi:hypothetical protein
MSEPAASVATSTALAIGAVTVTGTFFGMHFDALLVGLFGAMCALRYAGPLTKWELFLTLFGGTLLGGMLAPVEHVAVVHYYTWLEPVGDQLRLACAFLTGLGGHTAIMFALKALDRKGGAQ